MSEPLRVEERLLLRRRGKDVLGVLEAEAREREERVELPHCREPARNLRAGAPPPGLDRERELRSPEKKSGEGSEEHISPRIEIFDETRARAGWGARPGPRRRSLRAGGFREARRGPRGHETEPRRRSGRRSFGGGKKA